MQPHQHTDLLMWSSHADNNVTRPQTCSDVRLWLCSFQIKKLVKNEIKDTKDTVKEIIKQAEVLAADVKLVKEDIEDLRHTLDEHTAMLGQILDNLAAQM